MSRKPRESQRNWTQAEMKVTLNEVKKNLQGINREVDKAENHMNVLEHKEDKKKHSTRRARRKKESKKTRVG